MELADYIRSVPDFPKKGILFRDITTLLKVPEAFGEAVDKLSELAGEVGPDLIVAVESRGFILGGAVAYKLGCGFVPARKPGKLPAEVLREEYELEYGTDALEVHRDAVGEGSKVVVLDDLLATGGTAAATCRLVEKLGGRVARVVFLIELTELKGRERLSRWDVVSIIKY
ncbi:MAG: adenine phosphoribosyltransferase [Candidatus Latescibacterota bacterium]|nr:MAG: adenine phosphoribosyltransferase [Candidatus Latescibacterota bacterium]HDI00003.1 adenine phosphoribosyltransferase [Bacillota bacterium]